MSRITRAGGTGESHKLILGKFDSYIRTQGKAKIPLKTNVRLVDLKTFTWVSTSSGDDTRL